MPHPGRFLSEMVGKRKGERDNAGSPPVVGIILPFSKYIVQAQYAVIFMKLSRDLHIHL